VPEHRTPEKIDDEDEDEDDWEKQRTP